MSSVIVLSEDQVRLVLRILEHVANELAEAITSQNWDWLDDLFGATWEELDELRKAISTAREEDS